MKTIGKFIRDIAITAAIIYAAVTTALWIFQERLIFPGAYQALPAWIDVAFPVAVDRVTIPVGDGVHLSALYRRPDPDRPTILVFHGNAGYPEDYGFLYKAWAFSGYGIVAPVYRGYPRSSGEVDADGMMRDALSVYDWTIKRHPSSSVIVFGQSLGSASAVKVSANRKVAATILVSPFKSMLSVVSERFPFLPVSLALRPTLRNDLEMPRTSAPTIIFHGDRDDLVNIASARALAALAPSDPRFVVVEGAGHINGLYGSIMVLQINSFIAEHGGRRG
jgi:pimeloyl-ACP methyl ester carboxylesterase|nr:alpha/beta fold hydrolase [Neorhizobium tomejilense]